MPAVPVVLPAAPGCVAGVPPAGVDAAAAVDDVARSPAPLALRPPLSEPGVDGPDVDDAEAAVAGSFGEAASSRAPV